MQRDDDVYLRSILELSRGIQARVERHGRAGYDANEDLCLALIHLIQNIGEAARQLSPDSRLAFRECPGTR